MRDLGDNKGSKMMMREGVVFGDDFPGRICELSTERAWGNKSCPSSASSFSLSLSLVLSL